jgi:hypothetical protein
MPLEFKLEANTPENVAAHRAFIESEMNLCDKISEVLSDIDDLNSFNLQALSDPALRPCLSEIFGLQNLQPRYFGQIKKFLLKMNKEVRSGADKDSAKCSTILLFSDPMGLQHAAFNGEYSSHYSIAKVELDGQIIISMIVFLDPQNSAQVHAGIVKSLRFLIKSELDNIPLGRNIALPLHAFAAQQVGAEVVAARPIGEIMPALLIEAGFTVLERGDEGVKSFFGVGIYERTLKLTPGRGLNCYYYINQPALHSYYTNYLKDLSHPSVPFASPRVASGEFLGGAAGPPANAGAPFLPVFVRSAPLAGSPVWVAPKNPPLPPVGLVRKCRHF